jgi:hypothetical protein
MTGEDREIISAWGRTLVRPVTVRLMLTQDERSVRFREFCDTLGGLAPGLQVKEEATGGTEKRPAIGIGENIRYEAIPLERELRPFLDALSGPLSLAAGLPEQPSSLLGALQVPARLRVYITPRCPVCPKTVRLLLFFALSSEHVHVAVVDGDLFCEAAQADRIRSVPTTIFDDQFRWTGELPLQEVLNALLARDPSQMAADSLRGILDEGNAALLSDLMRRRGKVFPGFLQLLTHETWSVRLSAMTAFEFLAESSPEVASQAVAFLWQQFPAVIDQVKGDILYLLGVCGDPTAIPMIKALLPGLRSEELREAAEEALQNLLATRVRGKSGHEESL